MINTIRKILQGIMINKY